MAKLTAFIMSLILFVSQLFGAAGSADYQKQLSLKDRLTRLTSKSETESARFEGKHDGKSWNETDVFTLDDTVILKKEKGKEFVILNITDPHFEDYGYRSVLSAEGEATIRRLVAETSPDLITVTGDIVCGESDVYSIKKFTDMMEGFGVPWAPVFGNHDDEANCDLDYLCDVMMTAPNCLMQKGDPEMGYGNYIINIAEENTDGTLDFVETLFMMDSHHSQPNEKQQKWYKWAADGMNEISGGKTEISVFMHIPLPDYQFAYDEAWNTEKKRWNDGYAAFGRQHESICCERDANGDPVDRGFFALLKDTNAKYVFCGHEHMNDFSIEYQGIRLTYTMKLGYGSGFQIGYNGGTVIRLNEKLTGITHYTVSYGVKIPIENIEL